MADSFGLTPSQTVGPFFSIALSWADGSDVAAAQPTGCLVINGQVFDGVGAPVPDAVVETWQADAAGRFTHPDDPRGGASPTPPGFRGFGRCATDAEGRWHIRTVKPGPVPTPDGAMEAPHLDVSVFARGLLDRVVTRIYFPDEVDYNASDPVIARVDPGRRGQLIAIPDGSGLRFDIHLQGAGESVFFDL